MATARLRSTAMAFTRQRPGNIMEGRAGTSTLRHQGDATGRPQAQKYMCVDGSAGPDYRNWGRAYAAEEWLDAAPTAARVEIELGVGRLRHGRATRAGAVARRLLRGLLFRLLLGLLLVRDVQVLRLLRHTIFTDARLRFLALLLVLCLTILLWSMKHVV